MAENNSLGWFTLNAQKGELHAVMEETDKWIIAANENGQRKYFLCRFPQLSGEEQQILAKVIEQLQRNDAKASGKNIEKQLKNYCISNFIELEKGQKEYLLHLMGHALNGFGALDDILCNRSVEEIALIGIGSKNPVYVFHKSYGWIPSNLFFESQQAVCNAVNRMAQSIGRRLTMQTPSINAVLPDGSRLHAAIPPIAFSGPCFTIRKFLKEFFTPLQLIQNRTLSLELAAFIWAALESNCSMLIAGNTGSGKTTTLNALLSFVPRDERIIVVEETPEISLPHSHVVKLNVVKEQNIGMYELIIDTLRMRPDRIVVGEVRSSNEMRAFIDTLLAGQGKGSYCTFHSQSSEEILKRAMNHGISAIDLASIDLLVVQRRWDKMGLNNRKGREVRHITEVSEPLLEGNCVKMNRLFEFDFSKEELLKCNESEKAAEKMQQCFSCNWKGVEREILHREKFLKRLLGKNLSLEEFFEAVNCE